MCAFNVTCTDRSGNKRFSVAHCNVCTVGLFFCKTVRNSAIGSVATNVTSCYK